MSTLVYNSSIDTYVVWSSPDVVWLSSTTTDSMPPGAVSRKRRDTIGSALDALHDAVTIDNIKIEFTASKSVSLPAVEAKADFVGLTLTATLTTTNTNYSVNGGAGTLPSVVRAGILDSWADNLDAFYSVQATVSLPIITITYTDNGQPAMLQFSL